jgi:hypothetical protein
LEALGAQQLGLFVITHADLDHISGAEEILANHQPETVWTYPLSSSLRSVIAAECGRVGTGRCKKLLKSLHALDAYLENTGRVIQSSYGRSWTSGALTVTALAPTHFDQRRLERVWERLLFRPGGPSKYVQAMLREKLSLGDAPNVLSLALVIEWNGHRVLLGGDVMCGLRRKAHSGWKGILRLLADDGETALVQDLAAVKVAHHGSYHSFEPTMWALHAASRRCAALIAPFAPSELPDSRVLKQLSTRSNLLVVSQANDGLRHRAGQAGWSEMSVTAIPDVQTPCAVVELLSDGSCLVAATSRSLVATPATVGLTSPQAPS